MIKCTTLAFAIFALTAAVALADPCTAPVPKKGTSFSGTVRYVGDGDGLCVGKTASPSEWIEVRVADFYAPELNAAGGRAAKDALSRIAMGKSISCVAGRRSYDRTIARCTIDGVSVGNLMRLAGVAEGGDGYKGR